MQLPASLRTPAQLNKVQRLLWPIHTCTTTQRAITTVAYAHLHDHTTATTYGLRTPQ